jgi:hypothetical protein
MPAQISSRILAFHFPRASATSGVSVITALAAAGQQRHSLPEHHQVLSTYRGELVGVAEGELAQEASQYRGRSHLVEHPGCAAGIQHVAVIDAVCAAHHRGDDRGVSLPAGLSAPDLTRVDGRSTSPPISLERPVCSANSSTRTNSGRRPDSARQTPPTGGE